MKSIRAQASPCRPVRFKSDLPTRKENIMGKYFLAWLCGVPAFVLVLVYLFVH